LVRAYLLTLLRTIKECSQLKGRYLHRLRTWILKSMAEAESCYFLTISYKSPTSILWVLTISISAQSSSKWEYQVLCFVFLKKNFRQV